MLGAYGQQGRSFHALVEDFRVSPLMFGMHATTDPFVRLLGPFRGETPAALVLVQAAGPVRSGVVATFATDHHHSNSIGEGGDLKHMTSRPTLKVG